MKYFIAAIASIAINHKLIDPLLDDHNQEAQCVKNVLSEVKRWQLMSNYRDNISAKIYCTC